jgi:hypothetical protein
MAEEEDVRLELSAAGGKDWIYAVNRTRVEKFYVPYLSALILAISYVNRS